MELSAERLASLSTGEITGSGVSDAEIDSMVTSILSPAGSLFSRGLAVAALGASLRNRQDAPSTLQNLAVLDSLVDMIGISKESEPEVLGMHSDVVFRIRSNCCTLLSVIMGYVAGEDPPKDEDDIDGNNQTILPMDARPAPYEPPQCKLSVRLRSNIYIYLACCVS